MTRADRSPHSPPRDEWQAAISPGGVSQINSRLLHILRQAQDQYGAAPGLVRAKAKRLVTRVPHRHWKTSTFVAALRCDGIEAPCVFDGPINGERFLAYVEQCLVPTLRPGDIVSLDNLASHKSKAVRDAIRAAGAKRIFVPAYSPDLNPIGGNFFLAKVV